MGCPWARFGKRKKSFKQTGLKQKCFERALILTVDYDKYKFYDIFSFFHTDKIKVLLLYKKKEKVLEILYMLACLGCNIFT